jgi:GntR family transcriptional regulator/MocR family aminotransferase
VDLWVDLRRRGDRSAAIYRALVRAIEDGRLRAGDRLPAIRALAADLGVARSTVDTVYERLTAEGYLQGKVGSGTFVTDAAAPIRTAAQRLPWAPDASTEPRAKPLQPKASWTFLPEATSSQDAPLGADFRVGLPDPALFPFDAWRRLVGGELRLRSHSPGTYNEPAGPVELRAAIAGHLGRSRSMLAAPDDILITNGTQQGLDLLARTLLEPGDLVALEDPGYDRARQLFRSHGASIAAVPVDAEGLVVQEIPTKTRLVFTTPSHQFPLGVPMSLQRRRELLQWAARNDGVIVEDDYDSEFRFAARPLAPLYALDRSGRVIYAGTFSKSLLPTLRMGYLVAPPSLRPALRAARQLTDWHGVTALQVALAAFISEGLLAKHVRRASAVYLRRREAMLSGIEEHLGRWLQTVPSAAGLHLAATVRPGVSLRSADLVGPARAAGIGIDGLAAYFAGPADADQPARTDGLVLGYGRAQLDSIDAGLAGIARLVRRFASSP